MQFLLVPGSRTGRYDAVPLQGPEDGHWLQGKAVSVEGMSTSRILQGMTYGGISLCEAGLRGSRVEPELLTKAEIRYVRFHDVRHAYAALMAQAGAPPKYVREQLGHSSIQVTMDTYSHLFPGGRQEWVYKLGSSLNAPALHPVAADTEKASPQYRVKSWILLRKDWCPRYELNVRPAV